MGSDIIMTMRNYNNLMLFFCLNLDFLAKVGSTERAVYPQTTVPFTHVDSGTTETDASHSEHVKALLAAAGALGEFGENVAHGIHAFTVEELQKFDPAVSEVNFVPVVNKDLDSEYPLLPHALHKEPSIYKSECMRTIDRVFMHMDDKNYDLRNSDVLHRIVHAIHMQEIWHGIRNVYHQLLKPNPPTNEQCKAIMDIKENGVLVALRQTALRFREQEIFAKAPFQGETFTKDGVHVTRTGEVVFDSENAREKNRHHMRGVLHPAGLDHDRDVAIFLYCAIQKSKAYAQTN